MAFRSGLMIAPSRINLSKRGALLFLAGLAIFLFFFRLGARDFETVDEARRALVIQGMVTTGDYAIPALSGELYLKKPPLFSWLGALVFHASGSTDEWAYRLPSAAAALVTVLCLFLLADRLLPRRAAVLAAIMLATSFLFLFYGTHAGIDMTLSCFVALAMLCLERARASRWHGAAPWGFWLLCGLAVLTKGPAGLLFPMSAALALAAGPGFRAEIRRMRLASGLGLVLLVNLPWSAMVVREIGLDASLRLLSEEALGGFGGERWRHAEPFFFYLYNTPAQFFPWCAFLPAALLALRSQKSESERGALRFAWAWILPALVILSFSHQKRPPYLLPAFGALCLWHAWAVDRFILSPPGHGEAPSARWLARFGLVTLCTLAVVGALAGGLYLHAREPDLFGALAAALVGLAIAGLFALICLRRGRADGALAAVVAAVALYVVTERGPLADWFNGHESARPFADAVSRATPPEASLLTLFRDQHLVEAYLNRPVEREDSEKGLGRRLASNRPVYVILGEEAYVRRRSLFRRVVIRSENFLHQGNTIVLASN
jgi:4-amino-4-deoxy-L-arabinose transferase-like glycosyltransferase